VRDLGAVSRPVEPVAGAKNRLGDVSRILPHRRIARECREPRTGDGAADAHRATGGAARRADRREKGAVSRHLSFRRAPRRVPGLRRGARATPPRWPPPSGARPPERPPDRRPRRHPALRRLRLRAAPKGTALAAWSWASRQSLR